MLTNGFLLASVDKKSILSKTNKVLQLDTCFYKLLASAHSRAAIQSSDIMGREIRSWRCLSERSRARSQRNPAVACDNLTVSPTLREDAQLWLLSEPSGMQREQFSLFLSWTNGARRIVQMSSRKCRGARPQWAFRTRSSFLSKRLESSHKHSAYAWMCEENGVNA